ncbi:transcriptional regulator Spx [Salirhabdus sp. Marseille-P4669]|uniref:transcriptional regulator Spx n=1 Tax=Salirhabdus sp. Marseille-P4669 TaxID=2042310 RepID=UPI000C7A0152
MKVTLFGSPSLSTRKAKEWLRNHEIAFVERDIKKYPITANELQNILRLTEYGTDEIIATRSKIYKELAIDFDSLSLNELLQLFQQYPGLLRNPIIIDEKRIQIGFNEDDIRQFLPRKTREYIWSKWKMENLLLADG